MAKSSDIFFHRYILRSLDRLNRRSSRTDFEGALIRVADGFGNLHPWPELGDEEIDQQLKKLATGETTNLSRQALACCEIDGNARRDGINLFDGMRIPESHFTMPNRGMEVPRGFQTVKIKGVGPLEQVPADFRLRIDFNESLSPHEFVAFWESHPEFHDRIDFVEDPTPFCEEVWKQLPGILAIDRQSADYHGSAAKFRVLKPACQPMNQSDHQIVITSYMDHPIGQLFAAWNATQIKTDLCGLVTHHLFHSDDPFVAGLGPPTPILSPPPGTGLGFDELLESLPWQRLTNNF